MKTKVTYTSIACTLLALIGIGVTTAADTTSTAETTHSDTLERLGSVTNTNHCVSPYNVDYIEALEDSDSSVRFAGCGGML